MSRSEVLAARKVDAQRMRGGGGDVPGVKRWMQETGNKHFEEILPHHVKIPTENK